MYSKIMPSELFRKREFGGRQCALHSGKKHYSVKMWRADFVWPFHSVIPEMCCLAKSTAGK